MTAFSATHRIAFVALAVLLMPSCATFSSSQTARPVPVNTVRLGGSLAATYNPIPGLADTTIPILPTAEISTRFGLSERSDLGLRLRPIGAVVDYKFLFLDGATIAGSFAPGLGIGGIAIPGDAVVAMTEVDLHVPLYFGAQIGKNSEWVLGPKVIGRYALNIAETEEVSGTISRFILDAGGVAGVQLGVRRGIRLGAEVNIYYDLTEGTGVVGEGGLGLFFEFL